MIRTLKTTVAILVTIAGVANAQWDPYPWKRVPRTADGKVDLNAPAVRTPYGKPDLSGFWMPEDPVKNLLNLAADLKPDEVPLTPWGRGVLNERIAKMSASQTMARITPACPVCRPAFLKRTTSPMA